MGVLGVAVAGRAPRQHDFPFLDWQLMSINDLLGHEAFIRFAILAKCAGPSHLRFLLVVIPERDVPGTVFLRVVSAAMPTACGIDGKACSIYWSSYFVRSAPPTRFLCASITV